MLADDGWSLKRYSYLCNSSAVASLIKITGVGASTVGIDLVDGHRNLASSFNLGDLISSQGVLGVLSNVDVSSKLGTAALVHNVGFDFSIANDGGILLARVDGRAVSGNARVD